MMKKLATGALSAVLALSLAACSTGTGTNGAAQAGTGAAGGSTVAIAYNNPPLWANWEAVQAKFLEETGIRVPADNKNSGQAMTAMIAEKNKPVADVAYLGITFGPQAVQENVVEAYKPEHFDEIPDDLKDPDGKWMAIHYGAIAFIVNKDALGDVPVPKSWADLLKPEYKDKVGFLDPTSAAVGYSVVTAANIAMGGTLENWDPGMKYLQQLEQNGAIHPKQTATAKVMKGEIPILIDADFNGYTMKYNDNAPIEVVIPQEGSLKVPYIASLVKNGPNQENGKKYIDFMLSDEGQQLFAAGYVRPIRNVDIPQETKDKFLPEQDYERVKSVDYEQMNKVQSEVNERWKSDVTAGK
ncbi:extracellular solute-binding protein [Paenibacillus jiagnxiensis]|uniref:extracellular solute-binding protein n=1 Tax=Paenibacillus jiagnxiensis TaxID=3228926 RepID=UPI0033BF1ED5